MLWQTQPQVSAVTIAYHNELDVMKDWYAEDEQFAGIYDQFVNGQQHGHYVLKDGFLMMHGKLCVTKQLQPKVNQRTSRPTVCKTLWY